MNSSGGSSRIVIIGAGHAGGRAAAALRTSGHLGPITLLGEEVYPPYERPPLSKDILDGAMEVSQAYLHPLDWYKEHDIELRLGNRVESIDRLNKELIIEDGGKQSYDSLLITTGARPRPLLVPGFIGPKIFYLRDINDSLALRQQLRSGVRIAIIGAGLIGLEIAAVARKKGAEVIVLELARQVLTRVCPDVVSEYIVSLHQSNGVVLKTGIEVSRFEQSLDGVKIHTSSGEIFEVDIVSIGIGSIPNAEIAALAGIAVNNGIVVDEFGRSSDPDIFAAGDVAQHFNPVLKRSIRLESWQNAQSQANAVARTMAGQETSYSEVPWFWTDQYQVNLQIAGAPLKWDCLVMRGSVLDNGFTVFQLDAGIPVAVVTVNNGRDMRPGMKMIEIGRTVDPLLLADKSIKLQEFCRN